MDSVIGFFIGIVVGMVIIIFSVNMSAADKKDKCETNLVRTEQCVNVWINPSQYESIK